MTIHSVSSCLAGGALARCLALVSALVFGLAGGLRAQDFEGKNITALEIRYLGEKTVDEERLRNIISSKPGTEYKAEKLDTDVRALFASGLVDDVRFLAEESGEGVQLIAEVATRMEYVAVGFVGNTAYSDQKLAKETKLSSRGILSDTNILDARRNIENYYHERGFPDTTVEHRIQPSAQPGKADLIFVINEGGKNEIRKIRFEGVTAFTSAELKKEMKTKPKNWLSWLTRAGRIQHDQLDQDVDAILDYYRSKGYLRANCPGVRREQVKDGKVDIIIPIQEGDKYTVAAVGFGRTTVFKPEELYPALTLLAGDSYNSKKMRDDMTMLRSYYGSRGYADAAVSPDIRDAGPNQVAITYRISEGSRYRVGKVSVQGNTKTKDKVIRRESTLHPGDWFNSVEMETTKKRLENLNYFSDVRVSGNPAGNGYRDLDILVEERSTGTVNVGVGFSSIDNLVGLFSLTQTNFDLFNPWNFTGGGQRFSIDARLGTERADFTMSLVEPAFMDSKFMVGGDLFYQQSTYFSDWYEQKNAGGSVFVRMPLGGFDSLRLGYRLENIRVDVESDTPANSAFWAEDGDYLRSALTLSYLYDSRDSMITARRGHKIEASLTGAGLGGDVEAFTVSVLGQKHWNLKWDSIFSIKGELASVDGSEVPIFERMFLGGANTLRGFEFRDVGPRDDPTGDTIGGNSLGYLTLEYSYPVIETLRLVAFYDMGFVNPDSWDLDPSDLYGDVGMGIRLKLPISPLPLALDYAFPIFQADDRADEGGQFNFTLQYDY
jgi:outer membrane protein insertion porin family